MKLMIHDLTEDALHRISSKIEADDIVITGNDNIRPCIGCFGCWLKTPGACIIRDAYQQMGKYIAMCSEMLIISKCTYGCYSPPVKNILDRSISYIHPYFTIKNGEMHHQQRYKKDLTMRVIFYGDDTTVQEKEIAQKLVTANAVNLYGTVASVTFLDSIQEMEELNI
ncbi:flavodoxin family protein [Ruminococcus sp. OA3]|uniref:flavodoxin family protein n=1 Tax=Ruminococcus sp. OA3 TaxID=2914164 RepID=UPI001F05AEFD|nr:flavodoxin family protein [Ruminococcus sp. OA3]MCH1983286.1 flavodoxin family protein [Ruminococcus sp. OA3]